MKKENKFYSFIKRAIFSKTLEDKSRAGKIAYIGVATAFVTVANMFFEFKLAEIQFSLTLVVSALAGIILGGDIGFVVCFLGDLVGFLYNSSGFPYYPWVGIAMGMTALISSIVVNGLQSKGFFNIYAKLAIVSILTFLICTVAINTTAFWILYSQGKVSYFSYLITRLFAKGQIINSAVNYLLLFVLVPVLNSIKQLKIHVE